MRLRFQGDDTIKKNVIAKYLQAEEQTQQDPSVAVTPDNYKFKYKGREHLDGRDVHVFEVSPKKKRQGLYRGRTVGGRRDLAARAGIGLPGEESVIRSAEGPVRAKVRDPRRNFGAAPGADVADTWLVGKAELTIDFTNFSSNRRL